MTVYPVRRSLRSVLWFVAWVLLAFVCSLAAYLALYQPTGYDRWLITLGMATMAGVALSTGLLAYGLNWIQRIPKLGSTVLVGYALGSIFVCLTVGWLANVLFLDVYDRVVVGILLIFALGLMLALGYLHARMLSARLDALIGSADALRLGRYHSRVELGGNDQFARLGEIFNEMAARMESTDRKDRHLDHMRSELQLWVGNDMRVPVARVLAMIDALSSGLADNPDKARRFMNNAKRNIHLLSDLMDDLYDVTQWEPSGLALSRQATQAEHLITATVASLARQADELGIALTGTPAPGLPVIEVDAYQIERVLNNLATHALHRTPPGGLVKINAYPMRQGVLFEVMDYYEGERSEDPVQLMRLFLDENDIRQKHDTVPLGIAIATAIVQAHGGILRSERLGGAKGLRHVFSLGVDGDSAGQASHGM